MPREPVTKALTFLRKRAVILDIKENPKIDFSDKKDIPILSLLEASKANYFVTGEKKLLSLKKFGPTLFLTPREAMEILEEN
jgi:predicted nucleic acid-binding protein